MSAPRVPVYPCTRVYMSFRPRTPPRARTRVEPGYTRVRGYMTTLAEWENS